MYSAESCKAIFNKSIKKYHVENHVDQIFTELESTDTFERLLYKKCWIDTVQWHLEDLIRDPKADATALIKIKRRIDKSNQDRTDIVEDLDEYIKGSLQNVSLKPGAKLNSETPGWLLDRMSILQLKLYHFIEKINEPGLEQSLKFELEQKIWVLTEQDTDLMLCFDDLILDLREGSKVLKLYKQMKMYNDPRLNPILSKKA
jgi:hypothetical protein